MNLYAAYGSNLNLKQMKKRCPNAIPLKSFELLGYRLVFKGVADIEKKKNYKTSLGIYQITKSCENSLDIYEDFPNLYYKIYIDAKIDHKLCKIMTYKMVDQFNYARPTIEYFSVIKKGYEDWGLNKKQLFFSAKHSLKFLTNQGYQSKNWNKRKTINFNNLKDFIS